MVKWETGGYRVRFCLDTASSATTTKIACLTSCKKHFPLSYISGTSKGTYRHTAQRFMRARTMKLQVTISGLSGTIAIPGSKSHTIRAVAIAALGQGQSTIRNPLISSDTLSALGCYRALGAKSDAENRKNKGIKCPPTPCCRANSITQ